MSINRHRVFAIREFYNYYICMKTKNYNNIIFIICLSFGFLFLLWKSKYGYIYNDEPFLLGLGYRLVNGDAMIANEWSVMSIVSYLIYPFMLVYNLFNSSTEGIAMFGRYSFILIWTLTIIFIYFRLKKYGIFTIVACMIFYLFAPLDMMTLSYNSFALSSLLITSTLLVTANSKTDLFLIGIFFAVAVISIPFLVVIYFIFTIFVLISYITKKNIKLNENFNIIQGWIYITLGSGLMLVLFLLFIISRISIKEFFSQIKYFVIANSEHPIPNIITFALSYINNVLLRFRAFLLGSIILFIISIYDRNKQSNSLYYLMTTLLLLVFQYWYLYFLSNTYPRMNLIAVPLTVLGVMVFILTKNRNYYIFTYFIIFSVIYSIIINLSSNLGIMAISSMFIVASFGSVILLSDYYEEIKTNYYGLKQPVLIILIFCLALQLSNQMFYRYKFYYMDKKIKELKYTINRGPGLGTVVHQARAYDYYKNYNQVKNLTFDIEKDDEFVFLEHIPWYFLINNTKWATYSTWGYWINGKPDIPKTLEINMMYYEEHPEKFPTYVLFLKENKNQVTEFISLLESMDYNYRDSTDFILYYK